MLRGHLVSFLALGAVSLVAAQSRHPVTGVPVDQRAVNVPLRQNIDDMYAAGGPQWDLYIRALTSMVELDNADPQSYFQIAGIHGKPYIEYDGAGAKKATGWEGYCPHGEKLFLPWHRPLVLLFEQVLVSQAKKIAMSYPQQYRSQYIQAAENLRSPYWDWAATSSVPAVTALQTLKINYPNGQAINVREIDNPLLTYKLPKAALDGQFGAFDSQMRERTLRCPSPQSYPGAANQLLSARPYKKWLYDVFTRSKDFSEFSSTADGGMSIEQIHNAIHWDGACGNQFVDASFSAFDPLFMLHHTNMDRLWAYWQAIRPDQLSFNESYVGESRFSTPGGTTITPNSPLAPFSRSVGVFHTSETVKSIIGLGYSYQGLEYWRSSPEDMKKAATQLINRLYNVKSGSSGSRLASRTNSVTRYFIKVQVDVTELERPCSIDVYVGGHLAGSMIVMGQPETGIVNGGFAIDDAVTAAGLHKRATASAVNSIQSSLTVDITKRDGTHASIESVKSLKLELEDIVVTMPSTDSELPRYGEPNSRPAAATEQKPNEIA